MAEVRNVRSCADAMRRTKARRIVPSLSFVQTLRSKEASQMERTSCSAVSKHTLHCALELSKKSWLLAIQFPDREQPSVYPIGGGDTEKLMAKLTNFFRLNVLRLQLVPLRQRRSDVALLSRHFLETLAVEHGTARKTLAPALIQMLMDYDWPGNVRELHNVLQRAVLLCPSINITLEYITHVPIGKLAAPAQLPQSESSNFREARARAVMAFERSYIEETLRHSGGNVTQAARLAGKDRRVFSRLMKRHHITRDLG